MFGTDFILNGNPSGPVATLLAGTRGDVGLARPYFAEDGYPCVTVNTGRFELIEVRDKAGILKGHKKKAIYEQARIRDLQAAGIQLPPVCNATTLRRDEWIDFTDALIPPQRSELRFFQDIQRIRQRTFPGLGTLLIEHETMSDPGKAYMDMDMRSEGTTDTPLFQSEGQPVPIFHASATYDIRRIEESRRRGTSLSTRGIEWATRRVLELVEDVSIGVAGDPLEWGASSHTAAYSRTPATYGALNFPSRMTKTDLTIPTGANPEATLQDVLEMRDQMYGAKHWGPYGIYHSTDWDIFLDSDYARLGGSNANMTLRQRLLQIGTEAFGEDNNPQRQIAFVKRLDRLTAANSHAFTMIMLSLNPNVVQALNGLPVTVFQYETRGGAELHLRVATIMLPEFFADYYGNCGLLHARTA